MKWINTQKFVSILKHFPNEQIEVSVYLGNSVTSTHRWEYSIDMNCFIHKVGTESKSYSEIELFRLFGSQHWKIKPFFSLKDDNEKQLAIRLIEELVMFGYLDDIISESEIDDVRICEHCHHLMNEGWLVDDIRTFCSDKCLKSTFPNIDTFELQAHSHGENSMAYLTKWEG